MIELNDLEREILKALTKGKLPEGNKDAIVNALRRLESLGLVSLKRESIISYKLTDLGKKYLSYLPEEKVYSLIKKGITIEELFNKDIGLSKEEINASIGILSKQGLIERKGKELIAKPGDLEEKRKALNDIAITGLPNKFLDEFLKRGFVYQEKEDKYSAELTSKGKEYVNSKEFNLKSVDKLNREIIENYENYKFRKYDLSSIPPIYYGGPSSLSEFIEEIKKIMVSMGFQEMKSNYAEEVFWNFDVMMFRQNHPDRDVQDTIYLEGKGNVDFSLLNKVKQTYINGIKGGYGYGKEFDEEESKRIILRGHTTATTFRYLYYVISKNPNLNYRFFSVDKVFRNETVDVTHLKEFYQIEGVVYEDNLTLRSLMGYIKTFYELIGIDKVRFKPTYNPYTEPSLEIQGYSSALQRWIEIGNSGMFRPETLYPLGIKKNVAAWGLALERAFMLKYDIEDIRVINGSEGDLNVIRHPKYYKIWS